MLTTSVIYPAQPTDLGSVIPYARLAENSSGRRLWCGQSLLLDSHQLFAALAGTGMDLGFGTAVSVMPLRHPMAAAQSAFSTAILSGHSFVAGTGPGPVDFQREILGAAYDKPVTATRRYVAGMRAMLDSTVVTEATMRPTRARSPLLPAPPVEVGLGVLREPMARLAGECADWAITWLTPHTYIRDRLAPAIAESAARAGRTVPRLAAVVHCAVARPGRDLVNTALQPSRAHLQAPHYCDMLNQAGVPVDPADPRAGAELLLSRGVVATGTPEDIADTLGAYHAAGVDEVIVNVAGVHLVDGPGAALRDLSAILTAVEKRGDR
ncbi:LLM class flavin-dependent oxidoreductase [Streptomyces sp. NPDC006385]|uniref:LLM class flavin-dependent oxidoreductase n=1 Tax=Streptomyces sp. NPDC006385 TaxID=3156761 RepID=UPI0033AAE8F5